MRIKSITCGEDGFVLVAAMMIMVILTLLGISATTTSVIERQIAVNEVLYKDAFYHADGGTEAGSELIEENVSCPNGFTSTFSIIRIGGVDVYEKDFSSNRQMSDVNGAASSVQLTDLPSDTVRSIRLPSNPANRSDTVAHTNIAVWGVTKYMAGSALQMVSGYEGRGKAAAAGGGYIEYDLHSQHIGVRNSDVKIATTWRHIIGQEGTCNY